MSYSRHVNLCLAQDPEADELLSNNPFALLVGMVLDQLIPLELAFRGPKTIADRLGSHRVVQSQLWTIATMKTQPLGLVEGSAGRLSLLRAP